MSSPDFPDATDSERSGLGAISPESLHSLDEFRLRTLQRPGEKGRRGSIESQRHLALSCITDCWLLVPLPRLAALVQFMALAGRGLALATEADVTDGLIPVDRHPPAGRRVTCRRGRTQQASTATAACVVVDLESG